MTYRSGLVSSHVLGHHSAASHSFVRSLLVLLTQPPNLCFAIVPSGDQDEDSFYPDDGMGGNSNGNVED